MGARKKSSPAAAPLPAIIPPAVANAARSYAALTISAAQDNVSNGGFIRSCIRSCATTLDCGLAHRHFSRADRLIYDGVSIAVIPMARDALTPETAE